MKAPGGGGGSSSCSTCSDPNNNINHISGNNYSATTAQAYYWEICQGSATITGSNTNQTVSVNCSSGTFRLKLTQFINGTCVESCEIALCIGGGVNCPTSSSCLELIRVDGCVDFQLHMNCGDPTIDHVNWFYTIGSFHDVPFGTSIGNSNQGYKHVKALFLPANPVTGNWVWDNYVLIIDAQIVFNDGTVCDKISTNLTLHNCPPHFGGTGRNAKEIDRIKIKPNPSKGIFTLAKADNDKIENLIITNFSGDRIKLINNNFNEEINISNEKNGIYFIRINFSDGTTETKKIILSK